MAEKKAGREKVQGLVAPTLDPPILMD
jgi:hypothetical protein